MERIAAQKNSEFTGTVESFGSNGEGIVHSGETVFFAPFTVVGEKVKLKALKVKDNIGYAKALEILTPADERVRPRCPSFTKCGGCQLQHIKYGVQLKMKSKTVRDALRKIAGIDYPVPLTVKSEHQFEYRNKMQIPVGRDAQGNDAIGFYAERSHRIVPFEKCPIHPAWSEEVVSIFREYMRQSGVRGYDERTGRGLLRHIVVRDVDGGLIVTAVTNYESSAGMNGVISYMAIYIATGTSRPYAGKKVQPRDPLAECQHPGRERSVRQRIQADLGRG